MKAKKVLSFLLASSLIVQAAGMHMGSFQVEAAVTTENVNHVLDATMTCHSKEVERFGADKANDGDVTTRWASDYTAPEGQWLKAEFSEVTLIKHIKIKLFTRDVAPMPSNVESFSVKYTDEQGQEHYIQEDYANTVSGDGYSTDISIELPEAVEAKSITLCEFSANASQYNNIGVAELEAYSNVIPEGAILDVKQGAAKLQEFLEQMDESQKIITTDMDRFPLLVPEALSNLDLSINGADFQQIIANDGSIVHPLTDKTVKVSFKVTDSQGKSAATDDITYIVKGTQTQEENKNQKPQIIPEIAEWYSDTTETLAVSTLTSVTYQDDSLEAAVNEFVSDYEEFTGITLQVTKGEPTANAINFAKEAPDALLGEEGYTMEITGDRMNVTSESVIGNIYGMQTILQMYRQNPEGFVQGQMRDYPRFAVRGLLLDIARKPVGMEMIGDIARTMRYYKMNDLQLHLSDNYIWLEDYGVRETETEAFKAYEAFRLESGLTNAQGESPTAKDYFITKEEMRTFIQEQRSLGMTIVPEIDIPAHATSFTKVWPELMLTGQTAASLGSPNRPLVDHFDISKQETIEKIKEIFDDYTTGETPTFDEETIVHIGADEFVHSATAYRNMLNDLVPHVKDTNTVRMWGGLTKLDDGSTKIIPEAVENVQINLWSADWSDGISMYDMGYDLINTIDNFGYMVPNGNMARANAYGDLLNVNRVFNEFEPNRVRKSGGSYAYVPSGDDQMLGAVYAIWSDNIDKKASGLSESDLYYRFFDALPFYAEKTWAATGKEKGTSDALLAMAQEMGTGPNVNPYFQEEKEGNTYFEYEFDNTEDSSANDRDFIQNTASMYEGELLLGGENSYVSTPIKKLGNGNALSFDVTLTEMPQVGQILFEATPEYGTHDIRIMEDGRLGFTRELYNYYFDYKLPVGKKVNVKIVAEQQETTLYINDKLVGKATGKFIHNDVVKKDNIQHATFALPLERIGSMTNAMIGQIDNVVVEEVQEAEDVYKKDQWTGTADTQTVLPDSNPSKDVEGKIEFAYDNNLVSRWHSNWQDATDQLTGNNTFTVELDFKQDYEINQFSFTPRQDGNNSGCITKADLYVKVQGAEDWTLVAENKEFAPTNDTKTITFETQQVGAVKFVAKSSNDGWVAVSEFDIALADKCVVYVEAEENGTATGSTEIHAQERVTVTAQPEEGYVFAGWYNIAGEKVSEEAVYEFVVTENTALVAKFAIDEGGDDDQQHTISVEWSKDDTHHWHTCTVEECTENQKHDLAEHIWDDGQITSEPTVTEKGEKTFTCTICSATKTEEIPATGGNEGEGGDDDQQHTISAEWSKDDTHHWHVCTVEGCTENQKHDLAEHIWDDGQVTSEPTVTEKGEKTFTCTICSATKTEEIPATGGNEGEGGDDDQQHTISAEWSKDDTHHWHVCTVEGCTENQKHDLAEHIWDDGQITKEATATATGEKTFTCTVCGHTKKENVPATGTAGGNNNPQGGSGNQGGQQQEQQKEVEAAKSELNNVIQNATTTIQQSAYTKETFEAFQTTLKEVQSVFNNPNATKADIEAAKVKLQTAIQGLKPATTQKPEEQKPEEQKPEEENPVEVVKPGVTFKNGTYQFKITSATEAQFTGVATGIKTVKIANTIQYGGKTLKVTSVANNALKGDKVVTKVVLGSNIKNIGNSAFEGCTKLTSINLKNVTKIGNKAFKKCTSLKKVTIPKKVTNLGKSVFEGCTKLSTITIKATALKRVGKNTFKKISAKAKIKVPKKNLAKYKKILKNKGQSAKVQIVK